MFKGGLRPFNHNAEVQTGFLLSTDATVRVSGHDIFKKPMEVKRRIGYLAEHPPVYADMTVAGFMSGD